MTIRRLLAGLAVILSCGACAAVGAATTSAAKPPVSAATTSRAAVAGRPHVFLIVLENESYSNTYLHNPNPYLGKRLQRQGTLLTQYHAIGHFSLDNYLAMMSGQAPNADTSTDCQKYANFNATTAAATINSSGQAVGTGCVFPRNVKTLANQLSDHHISWHGYMEDVGKTSGREQKHCGVPTLTGTGGDDTQRATPKDQYAARHNPFVYFHALIDTGLCRANVGPLTALPKALKTMHGTPNFSFITPDLCDDGHDSPCQGKDTAGSSKGGLVSVDHFLSHWIPMIEKSPAYKKNGVIIVTSDESEDSDTSSCCNERPGPSDPQPGIAGPGGGRIGTMVLSRCARAGHRDATPYNHYSLLRSLEDLFKIRHGGTDGKGHLGYAAAKGLKPFGPDLFSRCSIGGLA
jgi:phosphatidylinositol-3-phosphatase